jgi:hypothetical protein
MIWQRISEGKTGVSSVGPDWCSCCGIAITKPAHPEMDVNMCREGAVISRSSSVAFIVLGSSSLNQKWRFML